MKFSVDKTDKYTIISFSDEKIDAVKAPQLKTEFVTLFQSHTTNLILDLKAVKYVDSSGLSAFLVANRMAKEKSGVMIMTGLTDYVMKIIKISKLNLVLQIMPTIEEAIDAVFLHEIEKDLKDGDESQS